MRRRPWDFETSSDTIGCWIVLRSFNGSVVDRLDIADVVRHSDSWTETWKGAMMADWREREAS